MMACLSSRCREADLVVHDTVSSLLVDWRSWPRYDLHAQSNSLRTMLSEKGLLTKDRLVSSLAARHTALTANMA